VRKLFGWIVVILLIFGSIELASYLFNAIIARNSGRINLETSALIPNTWRSFELSPSFGTGLSGEMEKHYKTANAQGFKYPRDVPKEKPPGTVRIIALGGSTLYGWGSEGLANYGNHLRLANDETITYFLETLVNQRLAADGRAEHVEVINCGIPNYDTTHELNYFNETIYEYNPDMLIFVDGNNELYGWNVYNPMKDNRQGAHLIIDSFNARHFYFTAYIVARYFGQYFKFANTLQYHFLNKWNALESRIEFPVYELPTSLADFDVYYPKRAAVTLQRYTLLKAAADYAKAKMIVFLQPQMLFEDPQTLSEADLRTRDAVLKFDWSTPAGRVDRAEFMKRVRSAMPGYMKEIGVEYHDDASSLGSSAKKDLALYIDYTHVTPDGAKAVAEKLFPYVYPKVLEIVRGRTSP
jgi:hypothetical protein